MEVDDAMKKLGKVGKWQLCLQLGVCFLLQPPIAWNTLLFTFIAYEPPHHCKLPENSTVDEWIPHDSSGELSSCSMFINSSVCNQTSACVHGWQFDQSLSGPTMVSKWDLVCERAYLPGLSQMVHVAGIISGGVFVGKIVDKHGRKWSFIGTCYLLSIFSVLTVVPSSFWWFVFYRFMVGVFTGAAVIIFSVYLAETFCTENQLFFVLLGTISWSFHNIILLMVVYLMQNWLNLTLVSGIYALIATPLIMCWLPESVPWLYANNRIEEAERVLLSAAKMNNVTLTRPILKPLEDGLDEISIESTENLENGPVRKNEEKTNLFAEMKKKKKPLKAQYSVLELFRNRYLRRHMSLGFILFFCDFTYKGLSYMSSSFASQVLLSISLNISVEVPAGILLILFVHSFGNKKTFITLSFFTSFSMFLCAFTFALRDKQTIEFARVVLTVCAKFFVTGSYHLLFVYGPGIFPSNLRNQAFSLCMVVGRLGGLLTSFTPYLHSYSKNGSYTLMCLLNLLAAVLCLVLPETLHRPLPERVEDIEAWYEEDAEESGGREQVMYDAISEKEQN